MAYTLKDLERMRVYFDITPKEVEYDKMLGKLYRVADKYSILNEYVKILNRRKEEYKRHIARLEEQINESDDAHFISCTEERIESQIEKLDGINKQIKSSEVILRKYLAVIYTYSDEYPSAVEKLESFLGK